MVENTHPHVETRAEGVVVLKKPPVSRFDAREGLGRLKTPPHVKTRAEGVVVVNKPPVDEFLIKLAMYFRNWHMFLGHSTGNPWVTQHVPAPTPTPHPR